MVHIRIEPRFDCDVSIVGAGPAGSTAAYYLASKGVRVILIDRHAFPRDKVCGDFIGPAALLELKKLGVTDLPEYKRSNIIRRAALYLDGQLLISRSLPQIAGLPSYGRVIPRAALDRWIVQAACGAGAVLLEGHRVTRIEGHPDRVEIVAEGAGGMRTLCMRLLIGADGSNSICARFLRGGSPPSNDRIFAARAYMEKVEGPKDQVDLYFNSESFPGYYWLFPTSDSTANIGLGMLNETFPPHDVHLRDLLLRLIQEDPSLRRRVGEAKMTGKVVAWPLITYNRSASLVGHRVMLAGDAAGLINPLNGEGIQYALASGRRAAEVAASCLAADALSQEALSAYAEWIDREMSYDMALSRLIIRAISNRSLNSFWLEALRLIAARARIDPEYAEITGGILAGLVPASKATSLKVIGDTLEQASISLTLRAAWNLLQGPERWAGVGVEAAGASFAATYDIVRYPLAFLKWGFGLAADAGELGLRMAGHAFRPEGAQLAAFKGLARSYK